MEEKQDKFNNECNIYIIKKYYSKFISPNYGNHYTSTNGFQSIIRNKKIWASRIDCLNDENENSDIDNVYDYLIKKYAERDDFFSQFIGIKHTDIFYSKNANRRYIKNPEIFVISFSNDEDSLCMWNYYLKNQEYQGYSMQFDFDIEKSNDFDDKNDEFCVDSFYLLYDDNEKIKIISGLLDIIKKYKNSGIEIKAFKLQIERLLTYLNPICKSSYFSHENECRFVIVQNSERRKFELKYRNKGAYIIPYIEVPLSVLGKIKYVRCPPLNSSNKIIQLTKEFLMSQNIDCDVIPSKVPIRY